MNNCQTFNMYILKYTIQNFTKEYIKHSGVATISANSSASAIHILEMSGKFKDIGLYEIFHVIPIDGAIYTGQEVLIDETYLSFEDEE